MGVGSPAEGLDQVGMSPEGGGGGRGPVPGAARSSLNSSIREASSPFPHPPLGLSPWPTSTIAHQEFLPVALFTEEALAPSTLAPLRAPLLSATEQAGAQELAECSIFLPTSRYSVGPTARSSELRGQSLHLLNSFASRRMRLCRLALLALKLWTNLACYVVCSQNRSLHFFPNLFPYSVLHTGSLSSQGAGSLGSLLTPNIPTGHPEPLPGSWHGLKCFGSTHGGFCLAARSNAENVSDRARGRNLLAVIFPRILALYLLLVLIQWLPL